MKDVDLFVICFKLNGDWSALRECRSDLKSNFQFSEGNEDTLPKVALTLIPTLNFLVPLPPPHKKAR